ncbi:bifunctional DNA primase/polymerase [Umezawaea sp. Da 62-37]|uniref:bifunctional DNA primase/polymerase n=1 Tax=Umezawaea sp. Da 62-37 TaxID=3075927 RepID=UPI0028F6FD2A|nr:bifunctional DNA primase/polymerase [Umezawaea sp. Da 62-37]WNV83247.1 bifunctional DNA primase/polymerase [Umezawaea sp. Da 62-37]
MSTSTNPYLAAALDAAAQGFHVFPLRPGTKQPALHSKERCPRAGVCAAGHLGWEQRATTDPEVITRCWTAGAFNVGIATGRSGHVVVDLDTRKSRTDHPPQRWSREGVVDGHDVFAAFCSELGHQVPTGTRTVRTARKGTHLYFTAPAGVELRNTEKQLGWKVDSRAGGGYVVAPGSVTPDGPYRLTDSSPVLELPTWLVQPLSPKPRPTFSAPVVVAVERLPGYVDAALRGERDRVATAVSGEHDRTLFVAAVALGQLVGGGMLPSATAEFELFTAAAHMVTDRGCDCTEVKVLRTIGRGLAYGEQRPRSAPTGSRGRAA